MKASSVPTACLGGWWDPPSVGLLPLISAETAAMQLLQEAHPAAAVLGLRTTLDGRGGRTSTALVCGRDMLPAAAAALRDDAVWDCERPRVATLASEARSAAAFDGSLTKAAQGNTESTPAVMLASNACI